MTIYENIQNYKQTHFPLKRTCVASSSYWHWSFKLYLLSSLKHDGWWFAKGHPKLNRNDLFNRSNTSNRSPKHTRRFKTNYSHMVLVKLLKQIFGKSWEFGPRRGAGVWPNPNFFSKSTKTQFALELPINVGILSQYGGGSPVPTKKSPKMT